MSTISNNAGPPGLGKPEVRRRLQEAQRQGLLPGCTAQGLEGLTHRTGLRLLMRVAAADDDRRSFRKRSYPDRG